MRIKVRKLTAPRGNYWLARRRLLIHYLYLEPYGKLEKKISVSQEKIVSKDIEKEVLFRTDFNQNN